MTSLRIYTFGQRSESRSSPPKYLVRCRKAKRVPKFNAMTFTQLECEFYFVDTGDRRANKIINIRQTIPETSTEIREKKSVLSKRCESVFLQSQWQFSDDNITTCKIEDCCGF